MLPGFSLFSFRNKEVKLTLCSHVKGKLKETVVTLKGIDANGIVYTPDDREELCFVPFHRVHKIELENN